MISKIKKITDQIGKIYDDIIDLEIQEDTKQFKQKIEELELYLELENTYYEKLKIELKKSKKLKNLIIEEIDGDFSFDFEGLNPLDNFYYVQNHILDKNKKKLCERRIYNRIIAIFNELEDSKTLSSSLLQEQIITLDKKRNFIYLLDNDEVYLFDRTKTLIRMLEKANNQIYLNYLYLLQAKIDDKEIFYQEFIKHKYALYFISPNLEKIGIEDNFYLSFDRINDYKENNQSNLESEIINYQLGNSSLDIFLELEDILLNYNDTDFLETNPHFELDYYYFSLERLFWQTSIITIDFELISEHINELLLTDNINNENVRKSLVKELKN